MIWLLTNFGFRTALVLALASALAWLLRNQSAALRHALWAAALAITLLLGPLSFVRPVVRVPIAPQALGVAELPSRIAPPSANAGGEARASDRADFATQRSRATLGLAEAGHRMVAVLPLVWLIGALLGFVRIARSRIGLGRLRRDARPVREGRITALFVELRRKSRLPGEVELLSSCALRTPVAFGIVRPTVILPVDASSWPVDRLRVVLMHELSHVRRRDALMQLIAELAKAVHWYNPLVWHAVGQMALERERACDDEVVQDGARELEYAGHLVSLAGGAVRKPGGPRSALTLAEVSGLEARVTALLTPTVRRGRLTRLQRGLVAAPSLLAIPALALIGGAPLDAAARVRAVLAAPALEAPKLEAPALNGAQPGSQPASHGTALQPDSRSNSNDVALTSPTVKPQADDRFASPRSELVPLTSPRSLWPSDQEIRSSPERSFIERLRAAADHQKTWEYDLVADRATWALTRVRNGEIVAPLIASLGDPDWRIQAYAAWSLSAIEAPGAGPPIRRLLDHSNWRVRAQAASSLLELGQGLPMDVLRTLARDSAWQVRVSAVEFLRQDGSPEARAVLDQMRGDVHSGTRMQVEAALSELGAR
jgi:beta-lactamase regulating signal transducer with metallopeptidase domain